MVESIAITVIVLFAILLGFVQEYRAERAIEALKKMASPTARVLRDGREVQIPARALVPGDLIILQTGDKVPADGRLAEVVNLKLTAGAERSSSPPGCRPSSARSPGCSRPSRRPRPLCKRTSAV
jgi:P-type Ca2+ transporter type 2C